MSDTNRKAGKTRTSGKGRKARGDDRVVLQPVVFHNNLPCLLSDVRADLIASGVSRAGVQAYLATAKRCTDWNDVAVFSDELPGSARVGFGDWNEEAHPRGEGGKFGPGSGGSGGGSGGSSGGGKEPSAEEMQKRQDAVDRMKGAEKDLRKQTETEKRTDAVGRLNAADLAASAKADFDKVLAGTKQRATPLSEQAVDGLKGAALAVLGFPATVAKAGFDYAKQGVEKAAEMTADLTEHITNGLSHLSTPLTTGFRALQAVSCGVGVKQIDDHTKALTKEYGPTAAALIMAGGHVVTAGLAAGSGLLGAWMHYQDGMGAVGATTLGLGAATLVGECLRNIPALKEGAQYIPKLMMEGAMSVFGAKKTSQLEKEKAQMSDEGDYVLFADSGVRLSKSQIAKLSAAACESVANAVLGTFVAKGQDWMKRANAECAAKGKPGKKTGKKKPIAEADAAE